MIMPSLTLTKHTLENLKFEVLKHLLYSPELSLYDYYLFEPIKDELRGKHFHIEKSGARFLGSKRQNFFAKEMLKLFERWTKSFEKDDDYCL